MSKKPNAEKIQNKKLQKKEFQRQNTKKILLTVLSVVLAVALLTTLTIFSVKMISNAVKDSGNSYRKAVVFKSENYKVNAAMMSYFFYDMLYDGILDSHGANTPEELKTMTYDADGKENLYDYYSEYAATLMYNNILYAEMAIDNGVELEEQEQNRIEAQIESISNAATASGVGEQEYIFNNYGRGIKKKDIRAVLELITLANKHVAAVYNKQEATPDEIAKQLESVDRLMYYRVDYYMVGFNLSLKPGEKGYEEEYARVKKLTEELAACTALDDFLKKAKEFYATEYADEDGKLPDGATAEEMIADCLLTETVQPVSADSREVDKWAYDFNRKEGDTFELSGKYSLAALFMVNPAYSVDLPAVAVRYILIDADNYAQPSDAQKQFTDLQKEAGKAPTEADFVELVKKYSEDPLNVSKGGLCEDTYSADSFCNAIKDWLTTSKAGDITAVRVKNQSYLVYNCGVGRTRSEIDAELSVINQKYTDVLSKAVEDIEIDLPDEDRIGLYAPLN